MRNKRFIFGGEVAVTHVSPEGDGVARRTKLQDGNPEAIVAQGYGSRPAAVAELS